MARRNSRVIDAETGEDITPAVIRCRTYGHAWDEFSPIDLGPPEFGWRLSLRCTRCLTERHDTIDLNGGVAVRRYIHPEGYSDVLGEEKMTRAEYRQALYSRFRRSFSRAS
jgi:hypothetical protein